LASRPQRNAARVSTRKAAPSTRGLTVSRPELLNRGSDRDFRQFVHDMLAFAARIEEVRNRLGRQIGLAGQKYTVLIAIAHLQHQEGGVGINEIAAHLHLSGAFVTIETKGLIQAGLVTKAVNPQDRRRVLLTITPKATRLLDEFTAVQSPVNNALFRCLSAADFRQLRRITSQLVETGGDALRLLDTLNEKPRKPVRRQTR
jgi:MarR family transcriptional regulator, organic hydroperoxide resistance regulator